MGAAMQQSHTSYIALLSRLHIVLCRFHMCYNRDLRMLETHMQGVPGTYWEQCRHRVRPAQYIAQVWFTSTAVYI